MYRLNAFKMIYIQFLRNTVKSGSKLVQTLLNRYRKGILVLKGCN